MATPNFAYEATRPLTRRVQVGVVGSGDLEVLIESSNDGVVVAHGQLAGKSAMTMAIEGAFQGGSPGKSPLARSRARRACERGNWLNNADARGNRATSIEVRKKLAAPWHAS
jgi:hypothetical protein